MSLSAVHATLSGLKSCQADIGTGMDIVTDVAMDLAETQGNGYTHLSVRVHLDSRDTGVFTVVGM